MSVKKLLTIVLAVVMLLSMSATAFGEEAVPLDSTREIFQEVENQFHFVEGNKELFGVSETDSICLGSRMATYMVKDQAVVEATIHYYPVLNQHGSMVGLILAKLDEGTGQPIVNYTTEMCEEINANVDEKGNFIIIDAEAIYIGDGKDLIQIHENEIRNEDLDVVEHVSMAETTFKKSRLTMCETMSSGNAIIYSANSNATISVPTIKQENGSSYCWACTAVSLGQYRKPRIVLDEKEMAIKYAGDLYTTKPIEYSALILSKEYGVSTVRINENPTFSTIKSNIDDGNPMITAVRYNAGGGHSILINGYSDWTSKFVVAMDPLSGTYRSLSTTVSGGNHYIAYVDLNGASGSAARYIM